MSAKQFLKRIRNKKFRKNTKNSSLTKIGIGRAGRLNWGVGASKKSFKE